MSNGKKHFIEVTFSKIFYRINKFYRFSFVVLKILQFFKRDYILEKRRRGRGFVYVPLAINNLKRELLALKYLRNKILSGKAKSLVDKITTVILTLFFSRKTKSKDFEEMQDTLKKNIKYARFR